MVEESGTAAWAPEGCGESQGAWSNEVSIQGTSPRAWGTARSEHRELPPRRGLFCTCGALGSGLDGSERVLTDGISLEGNFGHGGIGPPRRPPGRQEYMRGC